MNFDDNKLSPDSDPVDKTGIPDIEGLDEPKWWIHRSLNVLEEIFFDLAKTEEEETWLKINYVADQSAQHVRDELLALLHAPDRYHYMNQSAAFWQLLEIHQQRIVLFCRNRSPVANIIFHMCRGGSRFNEDFINGYIPEVDFAFLLCMTGALARAPIRICDVRDPSTFLPMFFEAYPHFDCALCDWDLEPEEIQAIIRITKDSPIAFLCPQQ